MNIENLICELRESYLGTDGIKVKLSSSDITVIDDFLDNWENILDFNRRYYGDKIPKTVICGINPGNLGPKTGIPFLDFKSLSELLPNVTAQDTHRSAHFFFDIVKHFGAQKFYETFYVTNISWLGFIKDDRNLNYFSLPESTKGKIYELFVREMSYINPTTIISLGREVSNTVNELFGKDVNKEIVLPHPNYCGFPVNYQKQKENYVEALKPFVNCNS